MENLQNKPVNPNGANGDYDKIENILRKLAWFLGGVSIVIALIILLFFENRFKIFASFITIGGAFVLAGGIAGFLFAIPRSGTSRDRQPNGNPRSGYEDNTNLEEISDWLTKIIVGLTLVQFDTITEYLHTSARSISISFSSTGRFDVGYYTWAYGMIIFFMACGFAISYLWTRINFALILTVSKKRMSEIENIEKKKDELIQQAQEERKKFEENERKAQEERKKFEEFEKQAQEEREKFKTIEKEKDELLKQAEEEKEKLRLQAEEQEKLIQQQKVELADEKENLKKIRETISVEQSQFAVSRAPDLFKSDELEKVRDGQHAMLRQRIEESKKKPINDETDLQKGRWGGEAERNNKKLSADVEAVKPFERTFIVTIKVTDTSPDKTLGGPVAFFVHDSFRFKDNVIIAQEKTRGEAKIQLTASEAFTVGAICPDGTELELDLNDQPNYPPNFYWSKEKAV